MKCNELGIEGFRSEWLPDSFLIRTICLAHDLGHPPFGHDGEVALNRCMLDHGGFEANGQALRIATRLEKYTEKWGLDLTRRAVLGLIKYPAPYSDVNNKEFYPNPRENLQEKPVFKADEFRPPKCYLYGEHEQIVKGWVACENSEWERFSDVKEFPPEERKHDETVHKSLDTSIMELADDIAYGVHDLEDGIALGFINRRKFREWLDENSAIRGCTNKTNRDVLKPLLEKGCFENENDLLENLFGQSQYKRKGAIGQIVGYFIRSITIEEEKGFDHPLFRYRAKFDSIEIEDALKTLKDAVWELVIKRPEVQQLEFKGQKMVTELFHAFSTDYQRLLEPEAVKRIDADCEKKYRLICDYIAGMTDDYAVKRYNQLFMPSSGSIFDRL